MLSETITVLFILLVVFITLKTFINPFVSWYKNASCIRGKALGKQKIAMHAIELLRPWVFLKLFATSITIVFLSRYMLEVTLFSHMPASVAGWLYALYQIVFILMLIPGGYLVEVKCLKFLLILTTAAEAIIYLLLAFASHFWHILILQILFGISVPLCSATVYAYIFKLSFKRNRGQALALYSNTLKGAAIVGIFTGGMLLPHLGMRHMFIISSILDLLAVIYAVVLIPKVKRSKNFVKVRNITLGKIDFKYVLKTIPMALKNINFLKIIFFVGLPLGIMEEGVILFSMPIILPHYHIAPEAIGKLLVLFSLGFFLTNKYISKKADKNQNETKFLAIGLLGLTCSIFMIAGLTWSIGAIIIALILLGVFRGFIFSPAISYVSKSPITESLGKNVPTAIYNLFETFGRIIGPIVLMELLVWSNYTAGAFIVLGVVFAVFTLLFVILNVCKTRH